MPVRKGKSKLDAVLSGIDAAVKHKDEAIARAADKVAKTTTNPDQRRMAGWRLQVDQLRRLALLAVSEGCPKQDVVEESLEIRFLLEDLKLKSQADFLGVSLVEYLRTLLEKELHTKTGKGAPKKEGREGPQGSGSKPTAPRSPAGQGEAPERK